MASENFPLTLITAIAGLAFGLLGAVLGVINTWRAFDRDRVRLRVVPRFYITSFGEHGLCVEVINRGFVPVTVSQVAFDVGGRQMWIHASLLKELPKRLEARTAFTASLAAGAEKDAAFARVRSALVRTACGCTFTGSSGSLRSVIKSARAAAKKARR